MALGCTSPAAAYLPRGRRQSRLTAHAGPSLPWPTPTPMPTRSACMLTHASARAPPPSPPNTHTHTLTYAHAHTPRRTPLLAEVLPGVAAPAVCGAPSSRHVPLRGRAEGIRAVRPWCCTSTQLVAWCGVELAGQAWLGAQLCAPSSCPLSGAALLRARPPACKGCRPPPCAPPELVCPSHLHLYSRQGVQPTPMHAACRPPNCAPPGCCAKLRAPTLSTCPTARRHQRFSLPTR